MTLIRLLYIDRFRDRHGKMRYYFRRPGGRRTPLPGQPGSREFQAAYEAALADTPRRETHRRYSSVINARLRVTGRPLPAAARYVALNPVRAKLVGEAEEWRWSSARAFGAATMSSGSHGPCRLGGRLLAGIAG